MRARRLIGTILILPAVAIAAFTGVHAAGASDDRPVVSGTAAAAGAGDADWIRTVDEAAVAAGVRYLDGVDRYDHARSGAERALFRAALNAADAEFGAAVLIALAGTDNAAFLQAHGYMSPARQAREKLEAAILTNDPAMRRRLRDEGNALVREANEQYRDIVDTEQEQAEFGAAIADFHQRAERARN